MRSVVGTGAEASGVHVGTVIAGKYRVDAILGEGGMGVVCAATHIQLDEPVAVKFLHARLANDAEIVTRFQREAKAARKIKSEHVVRILDVGELENGAPFMVMEYLAGTDLDALIRTHGPRSVSDAVDFVLQACEALAEAHVQGMVHRDLKPANLFISKHADETPLVKVLDFGISKVTGKDGADLGVTKTSSGVLGSPLYMAPEQMRSLRDVDARTDVWALGAIIHELLAGSPPFHATTLTELCATILQDPPVPIRTLRPDAPPALEAAILRCLAKDPAGRYPDVAALAMDLFELATLSGRASAERIFGVYRAAGVPRASKSPSSMEAARTMTADPTGPSLPLAIITPRASTAPMVGASTTGKTWAATDVAPPPMLTTPPPALPVKGSGLVIALVALVAVLGTVVVMTFVVYPRIKPPPTPPMSAPALPVSAPIVTAAPPPPSSSPEPVVSAPVPMVSSARPVVVKRPPPKGRAGKVDCTVPYTFDSAGKKHWKEGCLDE